MTMQPDDRALEEFVNWCEEKGIILVEGNRRVRDWADLLNDWEDERRGPNPPAPVTPIRPGCQP